LLRVTIVQKTTRRLTAVMIGAILTLNGKYWKCYTSTAESREFLYGYSLNPHLNSAFNSAILMSLTVNVAVSLLLSRVIKACFGLPS
jgi:hypothetical protein